TGDGHRGISHSGDGISAIGYRHQEPADEIRPSLTFGLERMRCHLIPTLRRTDATQWRPYLETENQTQRGAGNRMIALNLGWRGCIEVGAAPRAALVVFILG
ncbi:MAG: hypothetical protein EBU04_01870, partial [Verrucomicrobia bacterium]|nr:hypothetical protein [Verrucomicrobiota bacterium]